MCQAFTFVVSFIYVFFAGVLNCFSVVFDGFCHFSWAIKAALASLMRSENEMKVERDVVDVLELELKS